MFVDTSGLLCLHHADEPGHADAFELWEAAGTVLTHVACSPNSSPWPEFADCRAP
jgi:hypothetical protein